MSILTDYDIRLAMIEPKATAIEPRIVIDPFRPESLGVNSYDVHLARTLVVYDNPPPGPIPQPLGLALLDAAKEHRTREIIIPESGFTLAPSVLYLGVTEEYTETRNAVPFLDGKSSIGRLGIFIHATAGRGDVGFCGHWTMEISCVMPVVVYPGMPIGQLIYHSIVSPPTKTYGEKAGSKYQHGRSADPKPQASRMWKNFPPR